MPLILKDLPTLLTQNRAYFRAQFPRADQGAASYYGQLSAVLAMVLLEAQNELLQVDQDWPPSGSSFTPGRQSTSAALDQAAGLLGLPDGVGGTGRLKATISSGGIGFISAPSLTNFPDGSLLTDQSGQVTVKLDGAVTIPFLAIGTFGDFVSVTTGVASNLPVGAILTWQTPPPGAAPTVTLTSPLTLGADAESDAALLARIYDRLSNPRTGGRSSDWKAWLASVQAVKQVFVYPKRGGTGTVDVLIAAGGSGRGRTPSPKTQADALAAINLMRPVCSQVNVLVPFFYTARELTIRSLAYPTLPKYAWDWVSGSGTAGYQVTAYTPPAPPNPAVLQVTGDITALSPTFKAKVDAGAKPRIQVASLTGPAVPLQVAVTAYQVVAGPKTNLTLDALPAGWVDPVAGDSIYPGGPLAVNQLDQTLGPVHKSAAQRVLEYVDSLGPSRQSGYADPFYYWDDTCRISVLKEVILDTTDLDTTPMVRTTGNSPLSDTTIQIGVGMPAALDVMALDGVPGQPPEMLLARRVIVTGP